MVPIDFKHERDSAESSDSSTRVSQCVPIPNEGSITCNLPAMESGTSCDETGGQNSGRTLMTPTKRIILQVTPLPSTYQHPEITLQLSAHLPSHPTVPTQRPIMRRPQRLCTRKSHLTQEQVEAQWTPLRSLNFR